MARDPRQDSPAELAARYLRQVKESGEEEVMLSDETAKLLRSAHARPAAPAPSEPSTSPRGLEAQGTPAQATPVGESPPDSVRAKAAALPEAEYVDVRLALGPAESESDMFVEPSPVDGCDDLESVSRLVSVCEACELAATRTNVVFGAGSPTADLMFIGEGPGKNEDLQGVPFVGRAGELLDKILAAAEFPRDEVYIANIIKCRPPNNRTPLTSEIEACVPFLARQIALIKPRIICTLGLPATQTLLGMKGSMGGMRGKVYRHRDIKVIPTYHPAAALRDPKYKRPMWEDFLRIRREYDLG